MKSDSAKEGITQFFNEIKEVVEKYSKFGINDEVKDWIEKIANWGKNYEDPEMLTVTSEFLIWKDEDKLKKTTEKITERYYQYYLENKQSCKNVFIAHNDKDPIANMLSALLVAQEYNPIIMQLEPNMGRTIFDKFINIPFDIAIVVLAEDRKLKKTANISRAKQNVILEAGYFYGRLKEPKKVIILYDGKVEIPSNISAIEYIKIDDFWESKLLSAFTARNLSKKT